jgi:1,4-dihydroxy-2-naphthoate octaprenyltransferase
MDVKSLLLHLRLGWNLMLLPIFLWGFMLSEGRVGPKLWLGIFVFHILFYGGSVAFNAYYDQDEGPIGGLWNPPKATRGLLVFSLVIQAGGTVLVALFINRALLILSLAMWALSTAYSHPAIRLKARPWASLLTVSLGQGIGGSLAGWLCGQDNWTSLLSVRAGAGALLASLITTGFYPLTQIYQRVEDKERGDITFAVRWGERSFLFAIACMLAAAALGAWFLWAYTGPADALLMGGGLLSLAVLIVLWWRRFDEAEVRQNYLRMMQIGCLMAIGFSAYIGWHLIQRFAKG